MKKIKLLTPFLGLATVATVVAPIATSCGSNTESTEHVSAPLNDTKILKKKQVSYSFTLDKEDYDEANFVVSVAFPVLNSRSLSAKDFQVNWTITGNNVLTVTLVYIGENEIQAGTYLATLTVSYGSKWSQEITVYMKAMSTSDIEMPYVTSAESLFDYYEFESSEIDIEKGESYTCNIDFSTAPSTLKVTGFYRFSWWNADDDWSTSTSPGFETVEIYLDDSTEPLVELTDYWCERNKNNNIVMFQFYNAIYSKFTSSTKITVKLNNADADGEKGIFYFY